MSKKELITTPFLGPFVVNEHPQSRLLIPVTHRDLRMLRLFLPGTRTNGKVFRWSEFHSNPAEELAPESDWHELVADAGTQLHSELRGVQPPTGRLDEQTAHVLQQLIQAIPGHKAESLQWCGYLFATDIDTPVTYVNDQKYSSSTLTPEHINTGEYAPAFAWDTDKTIAWGSLPYPDSMIIAATDSIFKMLHQDPNIDVVSITASTHKLPISAGD